MLQHLDDPMPLAPATDEHRDLVLARVTTLRRRRRTALVAAPTLMAAAAIVAVGWIGFGRLDASPSPVIPGSPGLLSPGRYSSEELTGGGPLSYSLTVPEGWGRPQDPSTVGGAYVLSLQTVDGAAGFTLAVSPTWAECNKGCTYVDAPVGAKALADKLAYEGRGMQRTVLVDGRRGWAVDLGRMPRGFVGFGCPPSPGCEPLLGARLDPNGGGSAPPIMGRLDGASRIVTFDAPANGNPAGPGGTLTVAVWLWSTVPGVGASEAALEGGQQIIDSLQFEGR